MSEDITMATGMELSNHEWSYSGPLHLCNFHTPKPNTDDMITKLKHAWQCKFHWKNTPGQSWKFNKQGQKSAIQNYWIGGGGGKCHDKTTFICGRPQMLPQYQ